jgi:hypothetical protein
MESLYHATRRILTSGTTVTASGRAWYPEVAKVLDATRPPAFPERAACVFATDTQVSAMAFAEAQEPNDVRPIHLYEVRFRGVTHTGPMALVHAIRDKMEANLRVDSLAREYWAPTLDWSLLEVIGEEFEVVQEVPAPATGLVDNFRFLTYPGDFQRAKDFDTWHAGLNPLEKSKVEKLVCIGRDGQARTFLIERWTLDGPPRTVMVRVRAQLQSDKEDSFELELEEGAAGVWRIQTISHSFAPHLRQMGIPDALLPRMKARLGGQVRSSPTSGAGNVSRSSNATTMWNRLVAKGDARYDSQADVYWVVSAQ